MVSYLKNRSQRISYLKTRHIFESYNIYLFKIYLKTFSSSRVLNRALTSTELNVQNWHTWYLEGADSESGLRFLKFRLQNPFLSKFRPKESKLLVLREN